MTLGIGAVLGFIGCVMALINPIPELHDFFYTALQWWPWL